MSEAAREPPAVCFWELCRRCEFLCRHCRVAAGPTGDEGLPADELLAVADQLAALGPRLVVLTGGEPTLHPAWAAAARRLADGGVRVRLFTSGVSLGPEMAEQARRHGVAEIAIPLDGPRAIHDRLRPPGLAGVGSGFDAARAALAAAAGAAIATMVVTQVNRENVGRLDELYELLVGLGVRRWAVHLCQATGRARAARDALLCEPEDLERIARVLVRAAREHALAAPLSCSIGYLTAEELLRRGSARHRAPAPWAGCAAGVTTLAITARGEVKGCTTLPDEFVTASLAERPLADVWRDDAAFPYTRAWSPESLSGPCARCDAGAQCRAGCMAVAYGATGAIGANPYCLKLIRDARGQ